MKQVRKDIIRYALDFDILDIHTYSGYKGDLLVKITTLDNDDTIVRKIQEQAIALGMEVVVKDNKHYLVYEIYCITPDEGAYGLKL